MAKFTRSPNDIYSVQVEGESQPLGVTNEHSFFVRVYYPGGKLFFDDDNGEWREEQNLAIGNG